MKIDTSGFERRPYIAALVLSNLSEGLHRHLHAPYPLTLNAKTTVTYLPVSPLVAPTTVSPSLPSCLSPFRLCRKYAKRFPRNCKATSLNAHVGPCHSSSTYSLSAVWRSGVVTGCLKVEYDASMIPLRSDEGITSEGMNRDKMLWESSENEREAQDVCQSDGRVGICVGMYSLHDSQTLNARAASTGTADIPSIWRQSRQDSLPGRSAKATFAAQRCGGDRTSSKLKVSFPPRVEKYLISCVACWDISLVALACRFTERVMRNGTVAFSDFSSHGVLSPRDTLR